MQQGCKKSDKVNCIKKQLTVEKKTLWLQGWLFQESQKEQHKHAEGEIFSEPRIECDYFILVVPST